MSRRSVSVVGKTTLLAPARAFSVYVQVGGRDRLKLKVSGEFYPQSDAVSLGDQVGVREAVFRFLMNQSDHVEDMHEEVSRIVKQIMEKIAAHLKRQVEDQES